MKHRVIRGWKQTSDVKPQPPSPKKPERIDVLNSEHPVDSICLGVLKAVGDYYDIDPVDLEPFSDAVDPDALGQLFRFEDDTIPRTGESHITFTYMSLTVTLYDTGEITLEPVNQS